jgi:hypothetical protein
MTESKMIPERKTIITVPVTESKPLVTVAVPERKAVVMIAERTAEARAGRDCAASKAVAARIAGVKVSAHAAPQPHLS